jgi:ribosomal protein S18 acetylase RimI-like enzyme
MTVQTDYYTKEQHAHITDIVVIGEAEGKGVGKALLAKGDEWARERGARWITLNVFESNKHAQRVYEKAGYQKEWIKYLKEL